MLAPGTNQCHGRNHCILPLQFIVKTKSLFQLGAMTHASGPSTQWADHWRPGVGDQPDIVRSHTKTRKRAGEKDTEKEKGEAGEMEKGRKKERERRMLVFNFIKF